ncbi:MAG: CoA pyrophosphatase [Ectothiorhodospiraceae bacterium]
MDIVAEREWIVARFAEVRAPERNLDAGAEALIPAAVLVPIVEREFGLNVILTRRTAHLRDHAGQISFPGGRIETSDRSSTDAALREAQEEIGLAPDRVELLGRLPMYRTGTGFLVHPVVGLVDSRASLRPDPFEVDEIFEVPLDFVLDPANHMHHNVEHDGRHYRLYAIPYGEYYIWGATAGILRDLYQMLSQAASATGGL